MWLIRRAFLVLVLITISVPASASVQLWWGHVYTGTDPGGGAYFGAQPGWEDGYDGQPSLNLNGYSGIPLAHYRTWGETPAFYQDDFESPIPTGGNKTWSDIWLWSQNYIPNLGNRVGVSAGSVDHPAPSGYWGRLFLDYVPGSLGWTGPWQFDFPLDGGSAGFLLPVPITDNPYDPTQVTRMHLTVYTTPIPEPSSLLALGAGLAAVGLPLLRRRRT